MEASGQVRIKQEAEWEIKQERCLGLEGWEDGAVYSSECVLMWIFRWLYEMLLSDKKIGSRRD